MVSVSPAGGLPALAAGLPAAAGANLERAFDAAAKLYGDAKLSTGEGTLVHATGMAAIAAGLNLDLDTRIAGLLFAAPNHLAEAEERIEAEFGAAAAQLVAGLRRLNGLHLVMHQQDRVDEAARAQSEILRKMLLAMVEDIRVVLLRLASRVQTLRHFVDHPAAIRQEIARESLELYAPLANRLGVWQLKWELEDLSFRFLEPATYKRIARMLDEKRALREQSIVAATERLQREIAAHGIGAEIHGRPKHIYSIWSKMRGKNLDFSEIYDVRALRVLVPGIEDCYTVLGLVHQLWQPIAGEFDDYIAQPKANDYRSLHTAVKLEDGRPLEVQIRTHEMHRHAELGVAAHWRYKEAGSEARAGAQYDQKIAWLRQLLSWRDEITDSADWIEQYKRAALDDTIYVATPEGRVIDLPRGATPIDFAYRVHTDLGHRCRGAKVNGQLVPLNTPLANGQRVEIITVKQGGPSRDWLNAAQGYLASHRAKQKVKQWFSAQEAAELANAGRAVIARELQREGQNSINIEDLAQKLGMKGAEDLYLAAGRGELSLRQLQIALRGPAAPAAEPGIQTRKSRVAPGKSEILVLGVDKILSQLGRCCKPAPPDAIAGFITRGKGVSIHRIECTNFRNMSARNPERVIGADWGAIPAGALYAVDIVVDATDRQGLLRDISEVLSKEKINVTAVRTLSRGLEARMWFTIELSGVVQLQRILKLVAGVPGVVQAWRG